MSFTQNLDRELLYRLARSYPDGEYCGADADIRERIRDTVASLLDVVIQIKEDIENTESEEFFSASEEEEERARPSRDSYENKHDYAAKTYQPQAIAVDFTYLYEALHSALNDWTRDEVQRLVYVEMSKAQQQLELNRKLEEAQKEQKSSFEVYDSPIQKPGGGISEKIGEDESYSVRRAIKQQKKDSEPSKDKIDQQKHNSAEAPLNRQSNLLEDRYDIMQLIFSISEIEASGDYDELSKRAYQAYMQQFIAYKVAASKREQPERISTFSQTDYMTYAQHYSPLTDMKSDSALFLTNYQPKYDATYEYSYTISKTEAVNDTGSLEAHVAYLSYQDIDNTLNFNYIDYAQFRKILCKSPHVAVNCYEKSVATNYKTSNEEKSLRNSKVYKAVNIAEKEQRRYSTAHYKDVKAYAEKYSRRVYDLNNYLQDKNMLIEKLQAYIASTKFLASSYHHTNTNLRQYLKDEQQSRLKIEEEMLKAKYQYQLRLYKERSQHFSLNKRLIKEISYIRNDRVRNSSLGISQTLGEKYNPVFETTNPASGDLFTRSEIVMPPLPLKEAELSLSAYPHLKHASTDAEAASAIASLVDYLYVQTISEDVRLQLSKEYYDVIKTNLHEQLIKALKAQSNDVSLHFTPVKIQYPEKRKQLASPQKSPTTRVQEIKIIDPPLSLNSSVTIPLSLMSQEVQYMYHYIASTVFIKEPAKQVLDPYVQLNDEIRNSVPPKIQLEPQSESSDISRLSKVRALRIKQYGEVGCLFLLNIDEQEIQNDAEMYLLDLLKELSGSIPSVPDFRSVENEKLQMAERIFSVLSNSYVSVLLRTILFLVIFVHSGSIPDILRLKMAETASLIAGFAELEAKIIGELLNLVISTEYLIYLRKSSDLYASVRSSQAAAFISNLKRSLSSLNLLAQTIAFNPLRTCQSVVYYSCIRKLRLEEAGTFDVWNSFAVATSYLASKTQGLSYRIGTNLLSYQVVSIGCLALVFIEIGACEMDTGTQKECIAQCYELIKSCKEITKIPGFENVVNR